MTTKIASAADLKAIVEDAKHSPAELERLASNPEEVLANQNLTASPGAVAFLRSMGTAKYDEPKKATQAVRDANGTLMSEN